MIKFDKTLKSVDIDLKSQILEILPKDVPGLIVKIRKDSEHFFSFTLRLNITSKDAALGWIKDFEESSLTTYRVSQTFAENTPRIVFRVRKYVDHLIMAKRYLPKTSIEGGAAVEEAARKKNTKYEFITSQNYLFQAFAFETLGPLSQGTKNFINRVGRSMAAVTGNKLSTSYLYQRLFIAIQHGNSASILGTLPSNLKLEEKNFRCIQNSYPKKNTQRPHEKHTKCRATITTVIKTKVKKTRDKYLEKLPCEVNINWYHNHTISYEALKYRRSDELSTIFAGYFANGHSPSSALELHKMKLQTEYADDYYKVAGDGSRCPTKVWCYHLYYKIFQKTCREPLPEDMLNSLGKYIEDFNVKCKETCAMMSKDMTSNDVVVSICSPLSKRVLTLKSVQEIMFVTSSGNRAQSSGSSSAKHLKNNRILILLSPSVAGALPLGIIVSTSEREVVITKGIEMLKDMLQEPDFSPKIIISDDSEVERNSLTKMFPVSAVLLCKSHVLQTVWRFLSEPKNNALQDKVIIFKQFSTLINSKTKELFDENFMKLINLECIANNFNLSTYFNNYKRREMEWALYARTSIMKRNKYTYLNSEASIRVLKEQILHRTKAFSLLQLVDAMTSALNSYYERRLLNCVNNRAQAWESKYYMPADKIQGLECKQINETEYAVTHPKGEECVVNHEIGACTCPQSIDGTLCKHQYAVLCNFNILNAEQFIPTKDVVAKKHLYYIATGEQLLDDSKRWSDGVLLSPTRDKSIKKETTIKEEPEDNEKKNKKTKKKGKTVRGRPRKRKRKCSSSEEDDVEPMEEENIEDEVNEIEEIDNEDEEESEFLLDEYSNMLKEVQLQQGNSNRDADIEKELILEELKDMVKVVPVDVTIPENRASEQEMILEDLKEMFQATGAKLINKYEVFKPAIQAMIAAFKSMKSESALLSAYHSFGRNPKSGIKRDTVETLDPETQLSTQHVQTFNLQPTAEGHYAYLDEEGIYNMVVGPNSELHIQENVTIE